MSIGQDKVGADGCYRPVDGGLHLYVRLNPAASANRIDGIFAGPDRQYLKVKVTAAPEKGKANSALIGLVAREFGLRKTTISLISGSTDRYKQLLIIGDPDRLQAAIAARMEKLNVRRSN